MSTIMEKINAQNSDIPIDEISPHYHKGTIDTPIIQARQTLTSSDFACVGGGEACLCFCGCDWDCTNLRGMADQSQPNGEMMMSKG
jgi:hypothetical protein